jgi:pyruvate-formate lyase-activating enzyme
VNASTVLQLNPTAAEYAYHLVRGTSPEQATKEIASRYRVSKGMALEDYQDFVERVQTLIRTPDLDPGSYLDFERAAPHSADLTAPLRLDCALTYRLHPETAPEYAPVKRVTRELNTEEWKTILDRAWEFGIPQVTFTGGEATLREDLPDLIAEAESNGQVCGLLTDGLRLQNKQYLSRLLQTGLDHILFLLQPDNTESWQALETVLSEDIFVTVHMTLSKQNITNAGETLKRLETLGVRNLSLTTSDESLRKEYDSLRDTAAHARLALRFLDEVGRVVVPEILICTPTVSKAIVALKSRCVLHRSQAIAPMPATVTPIPSQSRSNATAWPGRNTSAGSPATPWQARRPMVEIGKPPGKGGRQSTPRCW